MLEDANILPSTGQENNIAQPKNKTNKKQKLFRFSSHFHRLTVVQVSFCSLTKGITLNICRLCFHPNKQRSVEPFVCLDLVLER